MVRTETSPVARRSSVRWVLAALALALAPLPALRGSTHAGLVDIVVIERDPAGDAVERAIREGGGSTERVLGLIGGLEARVPAATVTRLRAHPAVSGVWQDVELAPLDVEEDEIGDNDLSQYDAVPADRAWKTAIGLGGVGSTGDGVAVAVIDTGVAPAPDLQNAVVARLDLTPDADGIDRYGHGTHMTGLVTGPTGSAPNADIVSVKVAGWTGAVDVSTLIAAIEWVVAHKAQYNIRVLNLSFGTDASQQASIDPLNFAVQRAWDAGIFVVVASGNAGAGKVEKPGDDPLVLTVGAADTRRTASRADDQLAVFSAQGQTSDGYLKPDLVAPGVSLISSRAVGSLTDTLRPAARIGQHRFKGTGTSQATAIVSGVAALMFEAAPAMSPDEVKAALIATADPTLAGVEGAGSGLVDAAAAVQAASARTYASSTQAAIARSDGLGSIDASRGGHKVTADPQGSGSPQNVSGEIDVLGNAWIPAEFTARSWSARSWSTGVWAALTAFASAWDPAPAPPSTWGGAAWDQETWEARSWSDGVFLARSWSARSWSARSWSVGHWN